jgi:hypothetical protein
MFVQSKSTTNPTQTNGVALRQRRGLSETLVQWQNGQRRWVETSDLAGTVRLIDLSTEEYSEDE